MSNILIKENELIESKNFREKCIERIEILDKVKKLFLIPELKIMTARQVAEYYEVEYDTLKKCYDYNKNEIDTDGVIVNQLKDFLKGGLLPLENTKGKTIFKISDDITFEVPNRGIRCFSKRAILRIAVLLRDSEIAKEVRTQLLNTFEHSTAEQKTKDIDTEIDFVNEIGKAYMGGDINEFATTTQKYIAFQNRHIDKLKNDNKALSESILEWENRSKLNKAVRIFAGKADLAFGVAWSKLYDELRYKHHIGLSQRGKPPYIQYIKEDE